MTRSSRFGLKQKERTRIGDQWHVVNRAGEAARMGIAGAATEATTVPGLPQRASDRYHSDTEPVNDDTHCASLPERWSGFAQLAGKENGSYAA
ncbi:hypothetical protein [Thermogemmatispora onikobensis]|uniref:hypothetical protein n=1 Tax=Thermogemmatispora onikobensis TaxID=732234 RepID=UPI00114D14FB|nr:hypothetical protein [Thermogemmatispora onikobensis]